MAGGRLKKEKQENHKMRGRCDGKEQEDKKNKAKKGGNNIMRGGLSLCIDLFFSCLFVFLCQTGGSSLQAADMSDVQP